MHKWEVFVSDDFSPPRIHRTGIKAVARKILSSIDSERFPSSVNEVSVVFTSDKVIHDLNRRFRKKDKPTDVLSFSQVEGGMVGKSLGDVVISLETAERQCRKFGTTYPQEVIRLLIHGLLHLSGYDHEEVPRQEAKAMREKEDQIFRQLKRTARSIFRK